MYNLILPLVANEQLRGKTSADTAAVLQWVEFADQEILPAACAWTYPLKGVMQLNKQVIFMCVRANFGEHLFNSCLYVCNDVVTYCTERGQGKGRRSADVRCAKHAPAQAHVSCW